MHPHCRAQSFDILGRLLNHDDSFDKEVIGEAIDAESQLLILNFTQSTT